MITTDKPTFQDFHIKDVQHSFIGSGRPTDVHEAQIKVNCQDKLIRLFEKLNHYGLEIHRL